MKNLLFTAALCFSITCSALCLGATTDTTRVLVNLNQVAQGVAHVQVYPPAAQTQWAYVIPEIIPGTYLKINYVRFYKQLTAYDVDGKKAKVKRHKNVFTVEAKRPISYLKYRVKPSLGDNKVWDNILACAGTAYTHNSALLNFQLVHGYFEGYSNAPFKIEVNKPANFYGASSIQKVPVNATTDWLLANNYAALIDQPVLYAPADTASFQIGNNRFVVAVHAEAGKVNAEKLKPRFTTLMHAIDTFSGFTTQQDYYFILYYADLQRLKGPFKSFGAGSALEHKHASVYYGLDRHYDTTYRYYNYIGAHEYFHTITPLTLHSEKIAHFNFKKADMSRHVWLYEGFTDYLASLVNAQQASLNGSFTSDMGWAADIALKRHKQSMTQSGLNIIRKRNIISLIRKVGHIGNFYQKGKLIAMGIDMELMERSNGQRRLLDVLLQMQADFEGKYFDDATFVQTLAQYLYPEIEDYYTRYIEGTEIPPYETYFAKLGWTAYAPKTKLPAFDGFNFGLDAATNRYYITWQRKKNQLGLEKGDTILTINEQPVATFVKTEGAVYNAIVYPEATDVLTMTVRRNGQTLALSGRPRLKKTKYLKVRVNEHLTEQQKQYRKLFYKE